MRQPVRRSRRSRTGPESVQGEPCCSEPETREAGEEATPLGAGDEGTIDAGTGSESGGDGIPEEDVGIVAQRTGASEDDAREALEEADGDLADAVSRLE